MRWLFVSAISVLFCFALWAAQTVKPNFSGKWKLDGANSELHGSHDSKWDVEQTDKDLRLLSTAEGGASTEFRCGTAGQECDAKGRKVRLWYNGPKLVVMDSEGKNGSTVTKRRLSLSDDGNQLQVEVFHIVPPGPTEKLIFTKEAAAAEDAKTKR